MNFIENFRKRVIDLGATTRIGFFFVEKLLLLFSSVSCDLTEMRLGYDIDYLRNLTILIVLGNE